jgi:hypothetical protein
LPSPPGLQIRLLCLFQRPAAQVCIDLASEAKFGRLDIWLRLGNDGKVTWEIAAALRASQRAFLTDSSVTLGMARTFFAALRSPADSLSW